MIFLNGDFTQIRKTWKIFASQHGRLGQGFPYISSTVWARIARFLWIFCHQVNSQGAGVYLFRRGQVIGW